MQQGGDHFRDRHLDAVGMSEGENRLGGFDAFGGMPGGGRRLFDAVAVAEVGAEGAFFALSVSHETCGLMTAR